MAGAPLISIVDDDPLALHGIRELVESVGYKAVTFNSAKNFLQSEVIAETTCFGIERKWINGGQPIPRCQRNDEITIGEANGIGRNNETSMRVGRALSMSACP
jgi:hypothetical protein